ncbi:MAG TPA: acyltransferase family protein [Dehalococcoidia bacterium]|nr:acyltransferase family protein [Dehalococcoidia bacterium]
MQEGKRTPYLPGLDGLRALSVIAVVLYHAGQSWLPGGFLGVEVFLVISGYIITAGLLAEWRETGSLAVVDFWGRRARRLLPALFVLLLALLAGAALASPGELPALRSDALAAFFYVTNWDLIFSRVDYFESFGRPPLLQHLWSLAVEEQFYIVWPVVLALMLRLLRPRLAAAALLLAACASAVLMATLYEDVYDASRIYYGTDTRAAGLLLGAALACFAPPGGQTSPGMRALAGVAGAAGLATLLGAMLLIGQYEPFLYRGGFLVTGLGTAGVILAVSLPSDLISKPLGIPPLRWLGLRSYGVYLWHWPLLLLTAPLAEGAWWLLPAQLALIATVSEASFRLVEMPCRRGALSRLWAGLVSPAADTWGYRRTLGTLTGVVGVVAVAVSFTAASPSSARASHSDAVPQPLVPYVYKSDDASVLAEEWAPLPAARPAPAPQPPPPAPAAAPPARPLPAVGAVPMPDGLSVTAIGDSVLLGAARQLAYVIGDIEVDAEVGRQVWAGIGLLRQRRDEGRLGDVVVIAFGSNGSFSAKEFAQVMDVLADVRLVVFVNVRVPRPWEEANNSVIARGVASYRNAVLVDWYAASEGHPELFGNDGVHLTGAGVRLYAGLIADAIIANWK